MSNEPELDRELQELGDTFAPGPSIADEVMRRIETQPPSKNQASSVRLVSILRARTLKWLAAAAVAAAILLAMRLWPDPSSNGIAWADVARQINDAETLVMSCRVERRHVSLDWRSTRMWKFYFKDPGRSRVEHYPLTTSQPAGARRRPEIIIHVDQPGVSIGLQLSPSHPDRYTGYRSVMTSEAEASHVRNRAADLWTRLKSVTEDQTRRIGTREIGGVTTVGFEAPVQAIIPDPGPEVDYSLDGYVRVYARKKTAVPVLVEIHYRDSQDVVTDYVFDEIQWGVPLSDELFDVSGKGDFDLVQDARQTSVLFSRTRLRPSVKVRIGLAEGPPVITEADIEAIRFGSVSEYLLGQQGREVTVFPVLSKAAKEKLRRFTKEHVGEHLVIDFNGEVRTEVPIKAGIGGVQLDITSLGKTLEEFEQEYLTSDPEPAPE